MKIFTQSNRHIHDMIYDLTKDRPLRVIYSPGRYKHYEYATLEKETVAFCNFVDRKFGNKVDLTTFIDAIKRHKHKTIKIRGVETPLEIKGKIVHIGDLKLHIDTLRTFKYWVSKWDNLKPISIPTNHEINEMLKGVASQYRFSHNLASDDQFANLIYRNERGPDRLIISSKEPMGSIVSASQLIDCAANVYMSVSGYVAYFSPQALKLKYSSEDVIVILTTTLDEILEYFDENETPN